MSLDADVRQRRPWLAWFLGMLGALGFLLWAGSSVGGGDRWNWTIWVWPHGAEWAEVPQLVPGALWLWLAAAATFTVLSLGVWMLSNPSPAASGTSPWGAGILVLAVAAAIRWIMLKHWPLAATPTRQVWTIALDLALITILMIALVRQGRSLLWAATYAWHPLVTTELGLGHAPAVGAAMLLALAWLSEWPAERFRLSPSHSGWIKGLIMSFAVIAALALPQWLGHADEYDGPLPYVVAKAWVMEDWDVAVLARVHWGFFLLTIVLEIALVVWGVRRKWSALKILGHALVIAALCNPKFQMAWATWALAASVLVWNRAVWVMSALAMALWARHAGLPIPDWLMLLIWVPVAVVEIEQLLTQGFASRIASHSNSAEPLSAF